MKWMTREHEGAIPGEVPDFCEALRDPWQGVTGGRR